MSPRSSTAPSRPPSSGTPSRTRAIFAHALDLAGATPEAALHVGDSPDADVAGALAAGLRAVLVARDGTPAVPAGVPVIGSLAELPGLCQYPQPR